MNEQYISILRLMEKITNERERAKKTRMEYSPGVFLSRSERDILDEVGRFPDIGIKAIADNKGVTVGAASQMVKLLVSRGLLQKRTSDKSERQICISLTEEGMMSYRISEQRHEESLHEWERILNRFDENEKDHFLTVLEDILQKIKNESQQFETFNS